MNAIRCACITLIGVVLLVTAQGMALARGQAPAENQIVLCTGHGVVMVYTDADGKPTSPPQLCADGFALFAVFDVPGFSEPAQIVRFQKYSRHQSAELVSLFQVRSSARSPPIV